MGLSLSMELVGPGGTTCVVHIYLPTYIRSPSTSFDGTVTIYHGCKPFTYIYLLFIYSVVAPPYLVHRPT